MTDKISEIYAKARKKGVLTNGLTEDMFREQTKTDEGLRSFYDIATANGMRFHPFEEFKGRFYGTSMPNDAKEQDNTQSAATSLADNAITAAKEPVAKPVDIPTKVNNPNLLTPIEAERAGQDNLHNKINKSWGTQIFEKPTTDMEAAMTMAGEQKTPEDLLKTFAQAWSEHSDEGKAMLKNMEDVYNDTQNAYLQQFQQTQEYANLVSKLQKEVNAKKLTPEQAGEELSKLFVAQYGNKLEKDRQNLYSDYLKEAQAALEQSPYQKDWNAVNAHIATDQNKDLNSRIDSELEKRTNEIKQQRQPAPKSPLKLARDIMADRKGDVEVAKATKDLQAAKAFATQAEDMITSVRESKNFFADFGKSFGKTITSNDTWDFGVGQLMNSIALKNAADKADKGEPLTHDEELLLEAAANYMAVSMFYSDKVGRGTKAGQTTAASIPFMLEFMLTSGAGAAMTNATTRGITRFAVRMLGNGARKKGVRIGAEVAGKTLSDIGYAELLTNTLSAPRIAEGTISRMNGSVKPQLNDSKDGFRYDGRTGQQELGEALWNAHSDQFIENYSEVVFGALDPLKDPAKAAIKSSKLLGKMAAGVESNAVTGTLIRAWNNPTAVALRKETRFGGLFEETMEEEIGGLFRLVANTDVNNAKDAGLDIDSQIDIVLGLAPSVLLMNGAGATFHYSKQARDVRKMREYLKTDEERQMFDRVMSESRSGEFGREAHDFIREIVMNNDIPNEAKRQIILQTVDKYKDVLSNDLVQQAQQIKRQDRTARRETAIRERLGHQTNESDGKVYRVSIADNNTEDNFIKKGNVVLNEDGTIDKSQSDKYFVVTVTDSNGNTQIKQVPVSAITNIEGGEAAEDMAQAEIEYYNTLDQAHEMFPEGSIVTIPNSNGAVSEVHYDEQGNILVDVEGGQQVKFTPQEAIDKLVPVHEETPQQPEVDRTPTPQPVPVPQEENPEPTQGEIVTFNIAGTNVPFEKAGDQYYMLNADNKRTGRPFSLQDLQEKGAQPIVAETPQQDEQVDITNPKPIGTNKFGTIYQWVTGKAKEAAQFLRQHKNSYLKGVFHRDDIGDIDLVWGNDKAGLQHIIKRHILEQTDFDSITEAIEAISNTIQNGDVRKEDNSYVVEYGNMRVIVSSDGNGNWIVTAYDYVVSQKDKKRKDAAALGTPSQPNDGAGAVAPNLSNGKGTENNSTSQENSEEKVPDVAEDNAQAARKRGFRMENGHRIDRQQPIENKADGRETNIAFGSETKDQVPARYTLIDASELQPSHRNGVRNRAFFIDEAQPKERTDQVSVVKAQQMAQQIRPGEITRGESAYTGAPIVNSRGEVVQGNNRSAALREMYDGFPDSVEAYKQFLRESASEFGLTAEGIDKIQNPVLVRMTDIADEEAIRLGNMTAADTESGGVQRIPAKETARKLGDKLGRFIEILTSTEDEEATIANTIKGNAVKALEYLHKNGIINDTQYQSAFNNGSPAADTIADLAAIVTDMLFADSKYGEIRTMYDTLPGAIKLALADVMYRDMQSHDGGHIKEYVQEAIAVYYAAQHSSSEFEKIKTGSSAEDAEPAMFAAKNQTNIDGTPAISKRFSNFAIKLATLFAYKKRKELRNLFNHFFDDVQGANGDMFSPAEKKPFELAVKDNFNVNINDGRQSNDSTPLQGTGGSSSQRGRERTGKPQGGQQDKGGEQRAYDTPSGTPIQGEPENPAGDNRAAGDPVEPQQQNKIFTEDAYEAARRRMHERLNRLNAGLDPEMLSDGLIMAGYHVEKGARKFAEFAREMIREFGDKIRPYLKSFYNGLRDLPEAVDLSKEMDDYSTVMQFDVNSISIERAKETKKTSDILPSAGESVTLQPKKVDVEGLFGALNTKGEAKLSDHIEQESLSSANAEDTQPIGNVIQSKHTKTGEDIWIVKPSERVSDDEFKLLKARAKANNGYYSSFAKNRGFIFKSKEDANNFNNISNEEITTDQTSADTETAVRTAETVVGETATITRDRRDSSRTEGEPGTESIEGGVREPRNVELTHEQANEHVTTRQQAIAKIDNANDKITDQLAVLGFYEADTSDPTKLHESYGYIKTAEAKAVKDIDRLAKQLADDLGINVSKRKTIAKANIAPAGGDISFRLPLENGKELYLSVDIEPNYELNEMPYRYVSEDSLTVDGIMWRIEDPQASGMARYSLNNQYCKESIKYIDLLNDIRRKSKEYLPTILAGTTKQEIAKQIAEKTTRKKKDTTRIADTQSMLDLFGDVAETMNEGAQQEQDGWNPQASTDEELQHGYNVGDKVQYQGKTAEIVGFDNGRLVLDLMGGGWNTKLARFDEIEPINTNNNGDTTEIRTDGRGENGTAQTEPTRQSRDENGTLGGSKQPQDERPVGRRVDTGSKPHRVHDGERSTGTPVQPTEQTVTQSEQTDIEPSQWRNTHNFHARGGERLSPTAPKARYEANLAAIRLLKQLQDEGKQATAQEKDILAQYSGWGGLGEFFKGEPGTTYYSQQGEQSPYQVLQSLLTDEELQAAQLSRNSAYYTPESVINSMWQVAERLGFKGGNILEGSAGIGNIFALMPSDISHRSNLTAVEIDDITAGILSQLYPDATTYHAGFQDVDIPNNSQDLVITNVPFVTGLHVYDKQEKDLSKRFGNIHDFCIAKNVRKLKQGGLGIFISSSGTLDNSKDLRVWLNNEGDADVIGAFRLNRETFGGTSATSDIIVVRKRVNGQKDPRSIDVLDTATGRIAKQPQDEVFDKYTNQFKKPADKEIKLVYNKYFVEHPLSMGGEMGFGFEHGDTRWGGTTAGCYPEPTINQSARLKDWIDSIEQSEQLPTYDELKQGAQVPNGTYETYEGAVPYGSLILNSKGEICKAYHGTAVPVEGINSNKVKGYSKSQVLKDYNAIKQAIDNLLQAQTKNVSDSELKPYLQQLNKVYDDFVRKYGNLNRNTSLAFLRNDVQWASVAAIEKVKETVDVNGKKKIQVAKTDLFSKRVVGVQAVPKAENTRDGIILSMQQFGTIRPDKIAEWLGKPTDEVEKEIIGTRLGFRDPQTGNIQVRYEYLSGNVREKLAYAVEHNENGSLDANIEELRKVIPIDIPAHLIEFNIGSTWIPKELYLQYAKEKYDLDNLKLNHVGSAWVSNDVWGRNEKNRSEGVYSDMLGIQIYGHELMLAAMNNVPVVVSRVEKHSDGTSETRTDKVASAACSDKISQIKDDFVDWARGKMQQDSELADRIQKIYNDRFNAIVPMLKVDKEFLSEHLPGQNSAKYTLYPHQQQAVARGLTQALMLAHEVGTGKTISLISTAMEMRRLGTAKKPMIVVQNATTQQFVADAKDLYPNAKILTVSDRDRTAERRQEFYAKIKYNDWDLIIVPQSVFDMIPDSEARMRDFINEKIEEKMHAIEAAKEAGLDNNVTKRMERELGMLQEDLETNNMSGKRSGKKAKEKDAKKEAEQRANTEARAQAMLDRKTDDIENFDEMGIDALLIDEAHNYKHLGFATMMTRGVKGVDPSYSKRAAALYLKCQSIYERNGHKNVIFATGTPISNTAAEIWTFMKYLMPKQTLQENEIYYFDDFVHNFGKINEQLEFATNGKFKANNRFAQYGNVPELMRLWLSVADCTLTREVGQVNDKVPELEGGKAQDIFLPQSPSLIDIMSAVRSQLEMFEKMSGKEKRENSYIPLTMYGIAKRAAIDPRLVDANAVDEPLSKTNRAVEEILRSLNDSKKYKGTVAIFCDSYQNKQSGFNLFNDIKEKLTKQGVSANQIAIIRSEMSDSAKQKIFDAVREGDIRVIMGSTQTLGTGVNIQTRLHTLIHMDAPDRPMDYTQRNGRILRQGNMHKEWGVPVRVLRFGVEDSLDVTSYQRLKTKAGFIDSVMNGKSMIENNLENRVLEDVDEGIFDNPVAMLSGSQYALLKSQAERDLRKWSARAQQYRIDQILIAKKTKDNEKIIAYRKQKIADNEKLIELLSQTFPGGKVSEYNINGTVCHTAEEVKNALKEVNKDVTTESDALRKDVYGSKKALSYPITLNGVPFNVDVQLTRKVSYKDGQSIVSIEKEVLYSAPTLGIEPIASPTKVIDRLIDIIQDDIISGKQARDENAYSADYIKRLEKENALMREREGKPFEHQSELEKAQTLVDEYTKKMQAELAEKEAKYANQSHNSVNLDKMDSEDDTTDIPEAQYDELDYDTDNLTDAQQFDTDVLLGALDEAGISVERVSEEDAERELNSRQILEKSQKSTTFVPTSKVPKSELAVAHKALFAKVQDQSEAGIVYGVFSANYYHIFNGNQHQYAVRIEGNEDIISDIQKEIQYGTNKNANPLSQWVTDIQSGKGYDSRDNANATEQRGGDVDANALYGRQPTDSQRDSQESNGDSGITTPLRTTSGVIHGYAKDGKIYLTDKGFNPNTPIHEYTHLWAKAMQAKNPQGWQSVVDLLKGTPMWDEVVNDPHYSHLTDDNAVASEVLSRYSGSRGAQLFEQKSKSVLEQNPSISAFARVRVLLNNVREALNKFWNWVGKDLFHIDHFDSIEEVTDRILYDLTNGTDLGTDIKNGAAEMQIAPLPKKEGESIADYAKRMVDYQNSFAIDQSAQKAQFEYEKHINEQHSALRKLEKGVTDFAKPIMSFQEYMVKQGAVMDIDSDTYQDIWRAGSRTQTAINKYHRECEEPLANTVKSIVNSQKLDNLGFVWQNLPYDALKKNKDQMNNTAITPRRIVGLYLQAKDCEEALQLGLVDRGAAGFEQNVCLPTVEGYEHGVPYTKIIEMVEDALGKDMVDILWKRVRAAVDYGLDYQVKRGMISEETRNKYKREFYVPQRGWEERDMSGLATDYQRAGGALYGSPYNSALKQAKGRTSLAADPFAYITSIAYSSITSADDNVTRQHLLKFCLDNEELGLQSGAFRIKKFWVVREIDADGNIIGEPTISYAQPTERMYEHDKEINAKLGTIRKQLGELNRLESQWQSVVEIENINDVVREAVNKKLLGIREEKANLEKEAEALSSQLCVLNSRSTDGFNLQLSEDEIGDLTKLDQDTHRTRAELNQHVIYVEHNGQKYALLFKNEQIPNALNKTYKSSLMEIPLISEAARKATRLISATLTQYNPEFAARNYIKDRQTAITTLSVEQGAKFTAKFEANLNSPLLNAAVMQYAFNDNVRDRGKVSGKYKDLLNEYFEHGAQTGYSFLPDLQRVRKDFDKLLKNNNAKEFGKATINMLSVLTEASETSIRFAAYVTARESGMSADAAASLSKELTTNFNRHGEWSNSALMSLYSFMRATINGNLKYLRGFKKFPIGFSIAAAAYYAAGVLCSLLNPNDPDNDIWFTDYVRETNITLGKFLGITAKIPLGHFMVMFYAAGVNTVAGVRGNKSAGEAVFDTMQMASNELLPSWMNFMAGATYDTNTGMGFDATQFAQSVAPSVVSPFVDVWLNRNFMGGRISNEYDWNKDEKDILKYKSGTSQFYIDIANGLYEAVGGDLKVKNKLDDNTIQKLVDVSPSATEHIVEGYSPAIAETILQTAAVIQSAAKGADIAADELPFVRKFYSSYHPERAAAQQYYMLKSRSKDYSDLLKEYQKKDRNKYNSEKAKGKVDLNERTQRALKRIKLDSPSNADIKTLMELNREWNKID